MEHYEVTFDVTVRHGHSPWNGKHAFTVRKQGDGFYASATHFGVGHTLRTPGHALNDLVLANGGTIVEYFAKDHP